MGRFACSSAFYFLKDLDFDLLISPNIGERFLMILVLDREGAVSGHGGASLLPGCIQTM